jgi:ssRNA-specific RNase YbeY (16S rRNA maturation enzyme)
MASDDLTKLLLSIADQIRQLKHEVRVERTITDMILTMAINNKWPVSDLVGGLQLSLATMDATTREQNEELQVYRERIEKILAIEKRGALLDVTLN